jgi:hypothetical protein
MYITILDIIYRPVFYLIYLIYSCILFTDSVQNYDSCINIPLSETYR